MSNFVFDLLSNLTNQLLGSTFSPSDSLSFPDAVNVDNLSVSSSGLNTTITALGSSLTLPSLTLRTAGQEGHVTLATGMHVITGTDGDDTLAGSSGDDAIYGLGGNDMLTSGGGNDYMFGGAGSDNIAGGDGNDHLYGNSATPDLNDGADTISGGAGGDYIQGNAGNDVLDGGDGDDRINGGKDDDHITGGNGNDTINGNFGNDVIDGGSGDDLLRGGKDNDTITGGDGNDQIYGDLGVDTMTGGTGSDTFHFSGNDSALLSTATLSSQFDAITDFHHGEDHLAIGYVPDGIIEAVSQSTIAGAISAATGLLSGHIGDVVAVSVGSDTLLFYSASHTAVVDSVIDLKGMAASSLALSDFV